MQPSIILAKRQSEAGTDVLGLWDGLQRDATREDYDKLMASFRHSHCWPWVMFCSLLVLRRPSLLMRCNKAGSGKARADESFLFRGRNENC